MQNQINQNINNFGKKTFVNFSNQVIVADLLTENDCKVYFVPVYCRAKLKNIISMDFENLTAKVNIDFILSIYFGNMNIEDKTYLKQHMVLSFPRDPPVYLQENLKTVSQTKIKDNCFGFTVRKVIDAEILNDIGWAPFEKAKIIIAVNMKKIKYQPQNKNGDIDQWVKFKFNFMQVQDDHFHDHRFSLGAEKKFGSYKIADKQMEVIIDNQYKNPKSTQFIQEVTNTVQKKKKGSHGKKLNLRQTSKIFLGSNNNFGSNPNISDQKQIEPSPYLESNFPQDHTVNPKIDSYQYAYFIVPMYKQPYSMGFLIFLQLLLVGAVNVCIFFQDLTKSGKQMLNMAALMVSLIALLPNIRQNMGRSSQITLAEGCIIAQIGAIVFTFAHMISGVSYKDNVPYVLNEGLGIICIIITSLAAGILLILMIVHWLFWTRKYHFSNDKKYQVDWFERRFWSNDKCDEQILKSWQYQTNKISILRPVVQEKKKADKKKDDKRDDKKYDKKK